MDQKAKGKESRAEEAPSQLWAFLISHLLQQPRALTLSVVEEGFLRLPEVRW